MRFKYVIIYAALLMFFSSCNEGVDLESSQGEGAKTNEYIKIRDCWVNAKYLKSLATSQLLGSEDENNVLFLDSMKFAWLKCYNEYCIFDIKNLDNEYCFFAFDSIKYTLNVINEDTLLLNNQVYVSNSCWEFYEGDFLGKIKGDIFKYRYGEYLESVYGQLDTLVLSYNPFWNIYFLRNSDSCKNMFIVDVIGDNVCIYDFDDKCRPLTPERKDSKVLILKFPLLK